MPLPCPRRIFPHPVRVTKAISRSAIPDEISIIIHALETEFPDQFCGRLPSAQAEGMKGADLIFRIGGVTGFHVLGASSDAMKAVGPDRLAGGQSRPHRIIHGFIPVGWAPAWFPREGSGGV